LVSNVPLNSTHFLDTINGIATIRAFGWFPQQVARSKVLLDTSQRPSYLLAMVQQWLLVKMNIIVAILAMALVSIATYLRNVDAGSLGAGLVMLISLGSTLATVVNAYTGLEISLGAIERLKTFCETTEREDDVNDIVEPPEEWPASGKIVISNVSASYSGDRGDLTLLNLSLMIQPGEKVALCGRTGRYVSTLHSTHLRAICDHTNNFLQRQVLSCSTTASDTGPTARVRLCLLRHCDR
jgi:ATP-binding cassette, subfamily C (CFTR/MRP), member 1